MDHLAMVGYWSSLAIDSNGAEEMVKVAGTVGISVDILCDSYTVSPVESLLGHVVSSTCACNSGKYPISKSEPQWFRL